MSNAWQLSLGRNIPLTINSTPARIALSGPNYLDIGGGRAGETLLSDGYGNLRWGASTNLALFRSTWRVATNVPDLIAEVTLNEAGYFWVAVTADPDVPELAPVGVPGIGGMTVHNGDMVIWDDADYVYDLIPGSPLSIAEATALFVLKNGDAMTGPLYLLPGPPTAPNEAVNKDYVDQADNALSALIGNYLPLAGGVMGGVIDMGGYLVRNVNAPIAPLDLANKQYVDDLIASIPGGGGGASITVGDTPPASPVNGALWFDSVGAQLYVFYSDPTSDQWVPSPRPPA